jgi:cell wall-associated NlpC family hydrolase
MFLMSDKYCKNLENGANCQTFVYEILKESQPWFVPDFRSSELWEDKKYTETVSNLEVSDIVFFNRNENSYGAHLGIYVGNNKVLHLCKEIGFPSIWDLKQFESNDKYKIFIGAKRLTKQHIGNLKHEDGWEILF